MEHTLHLDTSMHDIEMNTGPSRWEWWLRKVAILSGIDNLDGDNSEAAKADGVADGYSLDELYDQYEARWTPARSARWVKANAVEPA
jgi:hypothetical protein